MQKLSFVSSDRPSVGIELELALVDVETMGLKSAITPILEKVPEEFSGSIKPELMQCFLEINTCVCNTIAEAEEDLKTKIQVVEGVADGLGVGLYWTATHPFSMWQDQIPSPNERYARLLDALQDMGRQLVTFGLHVHVGVDSGEKAVMICDRIMRHLPTLLAISCNSPWWNNRVSGLRSHRSKIMEGLPTAGLPSLMRNWSEFAWLMSHLVDTGFINSIRDIWWDVRPHHNFGTVEVRVCDMPGKLEEALGIAALIQCLVFALSEDIDKGTYQHDYHPMMVRQNKWRAARYGLDAELVDTFTFEKQPARQVALELVSKLRPIAVGLDCSTYLDQLADYVQGPTGADRQLAALAETGQPADVVRKMMELSRISK